MKWIEKSGGANQKILTGREEKSDRGEKKQKDRSKQAWRKGRNRKRKSSVLKGAIVLASICIVAGIAGCGTKTWKSEKNTENENAKFQTFTADLFAQEVSANTMTLHYTLEQPEAYGINEGQQSVSLGSGNVDPKETGTGIENTSAAMKKFTYKKLNRENQLTYDVIEQYLKDVKGSLPYWLYQEPLNGVSGAQTQLPVLFSEYRFTSEQDVEEYLELLRKVPEYLEELLQYETEKSEAGLFMPETVAEQAIRQSQAFLEQKESHYLITTFVERIREVKGLSDEKLDEYIKKNAAILEQEIFPAYEKLIRGLEKLKGTEKNEEGLCYLPKGREYYKNLVRRETGSNLTVPEMRRRTKRQIQADLQAMEQALGIWPGTDTGNNDGKTKENSGKGGAKGTNAARDETGTDKTETQETLGKILALGKEQTQDVKLGEVQWMLGNLEEKMQGKFPDLAEVSVEVKYVPESMTEHLSPAFYMIPALDRYGENVIYINQGYERDGIALYTTLAHEGYPGHLYQTVYYASRKPDPIRNLFTYGGYVEGWATYAEMCSYYLADLKKEQAILLQKNASILLGLYSLADMGIHDEGWSREELQAFFAGYGLGNQESIDQIYDLILSDPANYLKYYIGYLEFLDLKEAFVKEKGKEFRQEAFHKCVLDVGPAPFELVEKYAW